MGDDAYLGRDMSAVSFDDRRTPGHQKVDGQRAVNTSVAPLHADKRFWPRDMRGLLEIYEQGQTLQNGMKEHCDTTSVALENLGVRCETAVQLLLNQMEQILEHIRDQVSKPANVDWTIVLEALAKIDRIQPEKIATDVQKCLDVHTESINEIEQRMEEKLAEKICNMDDTMDERQDNYQKEMNKLRDEVKETQKRATNLEEVVYRTESQLTESFSNQHRALKTDFAQTVQDILRLQEKNRRADMAKVEPLLEEQLTRVLGKHHETLADNMMRNVEDILEAQQQQTKAVSTIEPFVKTHLDANFHKLDKNHDATRFQVKEIHKTVHEDVGHLFNEIGKIQRAMNLDYAAPQRTKKKTHLPDEVRVREFMTQTESPPTANFSCQTDENYFKHLRRKEERKKQRVGTLAAPTKPQVAEQQKQLAKKKSGYADLERKKAKMREALIKPSYNVATFYHTRGFAQRIARSSMFDNVTFFVIALNAIWIAVDTDHNEAIVLIDAHPVFIITENLFCLYFSIELLIRFLAFKNKRKCLKDTWFVFDSILVVGMVIETWVVSIILLLVFGRGKINADGVGNLSILRMGRMVKIIRMARVARILRSVPELVVIVKSIGAAFRSVSFFLLLTVIILYVYGVAFRQISKDSAIGDQYFSSVTKAMNSLLVEGMLPIYARIINDVTGASPWYWFLIMTFILLASVTVMNMLVGVLCEVVRTVAEREREAMTVIHVTNELREVMHHFILEGMKQRSSTGQRSSFAAAFANTVRTDSDPGTSPFKLATEDIPDMSRDTFETFMNTAGVIQLLQDCGVDALALMDSMDMIFEEKVKMGARGLRFVDFVEVVLNMRGTNPATVKDVKEQMRLAKLAHQDHLMKTHRSITDHMSQCKTQICVSINELRRVIDSDAGSDDNASVMHQQISGVHFPHGGHHSIPPGHFAPGALEFDDNDDGDLVSEWDHETTQGMDMNFSVTGANEDGEDPMVSTFSAPPLPNDDMEDDISDTEVLDMR
jgi:voltage-gated sodium channel